MAGAGAGLGAHAHHAPGRRGHRRPSRRLNRGALLVLTATALAVAAPAAAAQQVDPAVLDALRLPDAWATSRADDVVVAVLGDPPTATADAALAAATAAEVVRVQPGDDLARGIDATVEHQPSVLAVSPELGGGALLDDTVQDALRRAVEAGAVLVLADPGDPLPDDLPAVLVTEAGETVTDPEVTTPADDLAASTGLVAGTVALLVGQGTPEQLVDVITGTAQGADRTVDAAAALELAGNLGAGGAVPPPDSGDGALSPALVGAIAIGAALTALVGVLVLGHRRPPRP